MTPREFAGKYGFPIARNITLGFGASARIQESLDRYMLLVNPFAGTVQVRFDQSVNAPIGGININVNGSLIFTHHDHGSLVNSAFVITAVGGGATVAIIEAMMTDVDKLNFEREEYALRKASNIAQQTRNGRIDNLAAAKRKPNRSDSIRTKRK